MQLKERILRLAYYLASAQRYKKAKQAVNEVLNDVNSIKNTYFDYFMIFLVLSTIMILILEIKHTLPTWVYLYENVAVVIFILEWLGRLWVASDAHLDIIERQEESNFQQEELSLAALLASALVNKFKFIISPMSIIDLLAILPSYRALRFLRFLLLFRLFKMFRYTQSINYLLRVFVEKRFEFFSLLVLFAFMTFFAATVMYIFEGAGQNEDIHSFYDAIYWAVVTITTVGFGDIAPVTDEGRFVTLFLIIGGITTISFMTSIITTSMTEKLELIKSNQVLYELHKLKHFIVVCGFGKMGSTLAEELRFSGEKVLIIDSHEDAVKEAQKREFLTLHADASDTDFLKRLNIAKRVKYFVTLTSDDAVNLSVILSVKTIDKNIVIFTRAVHRNAKKKLELAGAKDVVVPYEAAGVVAYEHLGQPVAFSAIDSILHEYKEPVIDEIEIAEDMKAVGNSLLKIHLKKYRLKLLGVVRGSEKNKFYFHPRKEDFILEEFDILLVIGANDDIAAFKLHLHEG